MMPDWSSSTLSWCPGRLFHDFTPFLASDINYDSLTASDAVATTGPTVSPPNATAWTVYTVLVSIVLPPSLSEASSHASPPFLPPRLTFCRHENATETIFGGDDAPAELRRPCQWSSSSSQSRCCCQILERPLSWTFSIHDNAFLRSPAFLSTTRLPHEGNLVQRGPFLLPLPSGFLNPRDGQDFQQANPVRPSLLIFFKAQLLHNTNRP
ncbi:hypothetical protein ARMGADRAFT_537640 [Armillaria gallica]|uniref:Uncharacterized protein n=1 Tax=Armillaria gallica TaxID=47427 RepID=A0A2H3D5V9_ARMGA|nr:hypothetical protein ARMGADRAFT_537640 [Armillaria gallica]